MAPWLVIQIIENKSSVSIVKAISFFLTDRKFKASVEGELSTPRYTSTLPQGSALFPTLYTLYINDAPQTPGTYLAL
jgi:hypothetical protein